MPAGRPADRVVPPGERRASAGRVVRHDDRDREQPATAVPATAIASPSRRRPRASAYQTPSAATDEPDVLLRQAGDAGDRGERDEPILVEEPEAPEQQRRRERDRVELRRRRATAPAGRAGRRARTRAPRAPTPRCLRASRKTAGAPSATAIACTTSSRRRVRPDHQSGANAARIGSKCAPSREICAPVRSVVSRNRPCAVLQTACVMLPRSNRPVENARWRRTASAAKPAANAAVAAASSARWRVTPRRAARAALATARRAPLRWRAPGRPASPPAPIRSASSGSAASLPDRRGERRRVARRHEQRALAVDEQLARGGRVGGDQWRAARDRLERLVRDHASGLVRGAEDAERAARRLDLLRQPLVVDPAHPVDVRRAALEQRRRAGRCRSPGTAPRAASAAASRIVSSPCSGISLPTNSTWNAPAGCQPGRNSRSSAPTRHTSTRSRGQPERLPEEPRVLLGVGDDEVGPAERDRVDVAEHARARGAACRSGPDRRRACRRARRAG